MTYTAATAETLFPYGNNTNAWLSIIILSFPYKVVYPCRSPFPCCGSYFKGFYFKQQQQQQQQNPEGDKI